MQRRAQAQEAAVAQLQQPQARGQTCQPGENAPARQALPHGHEGRCTIQARAVGALHMKTRQQALAVCGIARIAGAVAADVDEAQARVGPRLGQPLDVRDLAAAQRTATVVKHGQGFRWMGLVQSNSSASVRCWVARLHHCEKLVQRLSTCAKSIGAGSA